MNLLVILSHHLSDMQIEEAKGKYNIDIIKTLPQELQKVWSNIEPIGELPIGHLDPIRHWIFNESKEGDYVLIQGEFGATFYLVDYCFSSNRIPIYATSARQVEVKIQDDITVTNKVFKHVNFRKYVRQQ